jgi:hypothetical protein
MLSFTAPLPAAPTPIRYASVHTRIGVPAQLNFTLSHISPAAKKFSLGKVVPIIRRIGATAGRVADVAGKVAVVASIL